jgi:hypothetical protein
VRDQTIHPTEATMILLFKYLMRKARERNAIRP